MIRVALSVLFVLASAGWSTAGERREAAAQQLPSMQRGFSLEIFARPALVGLFTDATSELVVRVPGASEMASDATGSRTTRPAVLGAGVRLRRGSFGIEGSWGRFRSADLVPLALATRANPLAEELEISRPETLEDSTAHLVLGQAFWTRDIGSTGEFSVGLVSGLLLVSDPETDRLLQGGSPADDAFNLGAELVVQQRPLVLGGSVGIGFRLGSLVLRPRLDALHVRPLSFEYTITVPLADLEVGSPSFVIRDEIRPFIVMVGLDIGFGSR